MKLLVTTDFSTGSNAGIRYAMQLAAKTKCELVFLHALQIAQPSTWGDANLYSYGIEETASVRMNLEKLIKRKYSQYGLKPGKYSCAVETGLTIESLIAKYAKKIKADYICMSTNGAGGLKKVLGTTASALITASPVPLFVVPKSYKFQPISTLLYASDLEDIGEELKRVVAFASYTKTKVAVCHYDYSADQEKKKQVLAKTAAKFKLKPAALSVQKVDVTYPIRHYIQKEVHKRKPSLLVLFTKKNKKWYERFFPLSSNAASVAFSIKTPMLVFRKEIR